MDWGIHQGKDLAYMYLLVLWSKKAVFFTKSILMAYIVSRVHNNYILLIVFIKQNYAQRVTINNKVSILLLLPSKQLELMHIHNNI